VCIENIFWDNSKYFEMSLQYFEEKLFIAKSFYLFIAIAISQTKMSSV